MSALVQRQVPEFPRDDDEALRARRIDLCTRYMGYRRDGRLDLLRPFLTDDCVLYCPAQVPGSIFTGTFHGPDEIIACLHKHFVLYETLELKPVRFVIDGDDMAILWTAAIRNRGSGPALRLDGMAHVRFRGDRFCYVTNNADTTLLESMLR